MKSRLAITTMVVAGMALGGPSLSLAATPGGADGASQDGSRSAAGAQYAKPEAGPVQSAVTTLVPSAAVPATAPVDAPRIEVAGAIAGEAPDVRQRPATQQSDPRADVRAPRQVAGSKQLPFTGLAAIPVLLTGLGLLGGGLAIRRGRS